MELTYDSLVEEKDLAKSPSGNWLGYIAIKGGYGDQFLLNSITVHINPKPTISIVVVLDYMGNILFKIDITNPQRCEHWIIQELRTIGYNLESLSCS